MNTNDWPITIERTLEGGLIEIIKVLPGHKVRMEVREIR